MPVQKSHLVVMIPAFNEEKTIGRVIEEIPKKIKGIDSIRVLVINDGSKDRTAEIAEKCGAIVLSHSKNQGLAKTFKDGLDFAALKLKADIIVNTDADLQYDQRQIPELVAPILNKDADVVLGSRFKGTIEFMPWHKKLGNQIATWAVRQVSGLSISDGQTGFRAFNQEAALRLNVLSGYTYTQETIVQAGYLKLQVVEIPIVFRKRADESRLISSVLGYAKKSALVLLMGYLSYRPLRVFLAVGGTIFLAGFLFGLSVLLHFFRFGVVEPHFPTALLSVALLIFGFQIIMIGLLAEMIKNNRKIKEEALYLIKKQALESD